MMIFVDISENECVKETCLLSKKKIRPMTNTVLRDTFETLRDRM